MEATTLTGTAQKLRDRRKAAGLSQERLAQLADCSTSTVRLIEKGWQASDEMLDRLQTVLNDKREATNLPLSKIGQDGPTNGT